jgi:SPP1 family predicted phage head-tail adaptor
MAIRAGRLSLRATVQRRVTTPSGRYNVPDGGEDVVYETADAVWLEDISTLGKAGRELVEAKKLQPHLTHVFRARYRAGLFAADRRLVIGDRVFDIAAVTDPDSSRQELHLQCAEMVDVTTYAGGTDE